MDAFFLFFVSFLLVYFPSVDSFLLKDRDLLGDLLGDLVSDLGL